MSEDLASVRQQLIALLRAGRYFVGGGYPFNWHPLELRDPRTQQTFTGRGAWGFILELLEADEPLGEVPLKAPPGRVAYVMKVKLETYARRLYVKIQLGTGRVIGRSFHLSDFD